MILRRCAKAHAAPMIIKFTKLIKMAKKYVSKKRKSSTVNKFNKRARRSTPKYKISKSLKTGTIQGFPAKMVFKHKYADQISLTDSAATVHYQFAANGMFDPNVTGTGHQPLYFDQMTALYNHYHVIGSKAKFTIVPVGTSVQMPYKVITWVNDDTSATGDTLATTEFKGSKTRLCTGGVNPSKIVTTNKWSAKKVFGGSVLGNDKLKGNAASNPDELSYYHITFKTLDGTSSVSVWVMIEILYVAVWTELKEIASS